MLRGQERRHRQQRDLQPQGRLRLRLGRRAHQEDEAGRVRRQAARVVQGEQDHLGDRAGLRRRPPDHVLRHRPIHTFKVNLLKKTSGQIEKFHLKDQSQNFFLHIVYKFHIIIWHLKWLNRT